MAGLMNAAEQEEMLLRASGEIKHLRAEIARLRPKAEAYDTISKMMDAIAPPKLAVSGEDLAWRLEQRAEEIRKLVKGTAA